LLSVVKSEEKTLREKWMGVFFDGKYKETVLIWKKEEIL